MRVHIFVFIRSKMCIPNCALRYIARGRFGIFEGRLLYVNLLHVILTLNFIDVCRRVCPVWSGRNGGWFPIMGMSRYARRNGWRRFPGRSLRVLRWPFRKIKMCFRFVWLPGWNDWTVFVWVRRLSSLFPVPFGLYR